MIRNLALNEKIRDAEYWQTLSRMTIDESIRLGEQLLTSQLMEIAEFSDDDHPMSLARSLGIAHNWKMP